MPLSSNLLKDLEIPYVSLEPSFLIINLFSGLYSVIKAILSETGKGAGLTSFPFSTSSNNLVAFSPSTSAKNLKKSYSF